MTANPFVALLADVPRWTKINGQDVVGPPLLDEAQVLAALAAAYPADLAEAGKLVEGLRELGHLHMLGRCLSSADMITALIARIAAQEAQIKGLADEKRYWQGEMDTVLAGRADEHDRAEAAETALAAERAKVAKLVEALEWYGEQSRLARLIHSEGDAGRHAIAADGGNRARTAITEAGQ